LKELCESALARCRVRQSWRREAFRAATRSWRICNGLRRLVGLSGRCTGWRSVTADKNAGEFSGARCRPCGANGCRWGRLYGFGSARGRKALTAGGLEQTRKFTWHRGCGSARLDSRFGSRFDPGLNTWLGWRLRGGPDGRRRRQFPKIEWLRSLGSLRGGAARTGRGIKAA
jgi:hypothetical protein